MDEVVAMKMKVLIIKMGYSETLDAEIGKVCSIGDVLRTTPILWALKEKYPESDISWLTSAVAEPLLRGNPLIDRLLVWDEFVPFQLMREKFDVLVNLEKIPGVCAVADMIDAWTKYGFRFDGVNGTYHAYERGLAFIEYIEDKKKATHPKDVWAKVLVEMLDVSWKGQEMILGYTPKTREVFDAGFNYKVGTKWPNKALPDNAWTRIEERLSRLGHTVSWQQGADDIYEYIDWIQSCRILVTNDSLGLHIALALHKQVVGLFGPTDPYEIYSRDSAEAVCSQTQCMMMPCYKGKCSTGLNCMEHIDLDDVVRRVHEKATELKYPGMDPSPIDLNDAIEKIAQKAGSASGLPILDEEEDAEDREDNLLFDEIDCLD